MLAERDINGIGEQRVVIEYDDSALIIFVVCHDEVIPL